LSSTKPLEPTSEPVDGRTARALRTREAIVDACIELLAEDDLSPSAPRIAERAGVSVRSVFQHFDDLETLYAAVGARVGEQVLPLITAIDPALPLPDRILAFVRQRSAVNAVLTPTLRAAVVHAPGSRVIQSQFQGGHDFVSAMIEQVFAPELDTLGPDRQVVFDALLVAGSWTTWNMLRSLNRRTPADTERVLVHLMAVALGPVVGRDLSHLPELVGAAGPENPADPAGSVPDAAPGEPPPVAALAASEVGGASASR
jgi:AcrR family transcriptional regulator